MFFVLENRAAVRVLIVDFLVVARVVVVVPDIVKLRVRNVRISRSPSRFSREAAMCMLSCGGAADIQQ